MRLSVVHEFRLESEEEMQRWVGFGAPRHQPALDRQMRSVVVAVVIGLAVCPVAAVDGVIEINQACAANGGCVPGDAAGFPVTITASGSYRLTGNLETGNINTSGIVVGASSVSIDLNGFSIVGPGTCTGTPVTSCSPSGSSKGIDALSASRITVRNGEVRGFGDQGVLVAFNLAQGNFLIENVRAVENGNDGFKLGRNGTIRGCVASRNGGSGIAVEAGALVVDNAMSGNANSGLHAFGGAGVGYARNVINDNTTNVSVGPTQLGPNLCNNALCP